MCDHLPSGLATLCPIVMVWIGDHFTQCKVGVMKSGGYSRCQCHYVTLRWHVQSSNQGLYHDNRKHRRHPFVVRCVKDMAFSLKQW